MNVHESSGRRDRNIDERRHCARSVRLTWRAMTEARGCSRMYIKWEGKSSTYKAIIERHGGDPRVVVGKMYRG